MRVKATNKKESERLNDEKIIQERTTVTFEYSNWQDESVVITLIDKKAEINAKDRQGRTLTWAASERW